MSHGHPGSGHERRSRGGPLRLHPRYHAPMHAWLVRLTRPEDPILWIGVAIALGYAAVGVILGVRARRAGGPGSS